MASLLLGLALTSAPTAQGQTPMRLPMGASEATVTADRIEEIGRDDLVIATGNVEIVRGATRLVADRVELNRATGSTVAMGRVFLFDGTNEVSGRRIEYNLKTGTGIIYEGDTRSEPYYRLSGARLDRVGEGVYQVQAGKFTTCDDDPPDWSFRFGSGKAVLDDILHGTGASFWVRDLPLIPFFPFFAAPLTRERQSGFLLPRWGSSGFKGIYGEIPYYWAISDSQDVTIAPNFYTKQGVGGSANYRYVLSEEQRGSFRGWYVNQFVSNDENRALGSLSHFWRIAPGLTFKADVNGVTDDTVLKDYGDQLAQRGSQSLQSNIFLTKTWPTWNFVADAFFYQDLTTTSPIELQRLPELTMTGVPQPVAGLGSTGLLYQVDSQFTNFARIQGDNGLRYNLHGRLLRPIPLDGLVTVTPYVGGQITTYNKTVVGLHTFSDGMTMERTVDEFRVRQLLEAGVDVQTIASRVYSAGGWAGFDAFLHTIEPRVGYSFIGGVNQDKLPQWTDLDDIPDARAITYSLINRIRAKTVAPEGTEPVRWEMVRLAVNSAYDLREQRPGPIGGTLIVRPSLRLGFRGDIEYDPRQGNIDIATTNLAVSFPRLIAGMGTTYSSASNVNFVQGNVTAQITRNFYGRWSTNLDVKAGTFVENRIGLDIRFQCWAATVEYVIRSTGGNDLRFAVNLLGMGGPLGTSMGVGSITSNRQQ
jgi:LPS-assembly protein